MTTRSNWYDDAAASVEQALDRAARHWRDEYDELTFTMLETTRRDHAIATVTEALEAFEYDDELTLDAISALIVDHSEFAVMGFDAKRTSPTTWFGRSVVARWLQDWQ